MRTEQAALWVPGRKRLWEEERRPSWGNGDVGVQAEGLRLRQLSPEISGASRHTKSHPGKRGPFNPHPVSTFKAPP